MEKTAFYCTATNPMKVPSCELCALRAVPLTLCAVSRYRTSLISYQKNNVNMYQGRRGRVDVV